MGGGINPWTFEPKLNGATTHHCCNEAGWAACPVGSGWLSVAARWKSCEPDPGRLKPWPRGETCGWNLMTPAAAARHGEQGLAAAAAGCSPDRLKKHAGPPPPPCLAFLRNTGHCWRCWEAAGRCSAKGSPAGGRPDCTWYMTRTCELTWHWEGLTYCMLHCTRVVWPALDVLL